MRCGIKLHEPSRFGLKKLDFILRIKRVILTNILSFFITACTERRFVYTFKSESFHRIVNIKNYYNSITEITINSELGF